MNSKVRVLLLALREATAIVMAAIEDYLDVEHKHSFLVRRRFK